MEKLRLEITEGDVGRMIYDVRLGFLSDKLPLEFRINVMATNAENAKYMAEARFNCEWPNGKVIGAKLSLILVL